jgi:diacylglycerol kinase family enzyme
MPFTPERPALLHNIRSGPLYRSFLHRRIERRFTELYPQGLYIPTESSDEVSGALSRIRQFQPDSVLIAGGDGTVNALLQDGFPEELPLGILPLGTANILAYSLYRRRWPFSRLLPGDLVPKTIRLGRWEERRFLLMAGIGFDGMAARRVSEPVKNILGSVSYFVAAFLTFLEWDMPEIYWTDPDNGCARTRGPALWMVASRFPVYFPPLVLSDNRILFENRLNLTVFSGKTRSEFLLFLLHRVLSPCRNPWFGYRATVESLRLAMSGRGQIDGEACEGNGSVTISDRSVTLLFSRSVLDSIERNSDVNGAVT